MSAEIGLLVVDLVATVLATGLQAYQMCMQGDCDSNCCGLIMAHHSTEHNSPVTQIRDINITIASESEESDSEKEK